MGQSHGTLLETSQGLDVRFWLTKNGKDGMETYQLSGVSTNELQVKQPLVSPIMNQWWMLDPKVVVIPLFWLVIGIPTYWIMIMSDNHPYIIG